MLGMKFRASTADRIEAAFAAAVALGDYGAAEGWIATARYVADRDAHRRQVRRERVIRIGASR
jgi:hypothetical protein